MRNSRNGSKLIKVSRRTPLIKTTFSDMSGFKLNWRFWETQNMESDRSESCLDRVSRKESHFTAEKLGASSSYSTYWLARINCISWFHILLKRNRNYHWMQSNTCFYSFLTCTWCMFVSFDYSKRFSVTDSGTLYSVLSTSRHQLDSDSFIFVITVDTVCWHGFCVTVFYNLPSTLYIAIIQNKRELYPVWCWHINQTIFSFRQKI